MHINSKGEGDVSGTKTLAKTRFPEVLPHFSSVFDHVLCWSDFPSSTDTQTHTVTSPQLVCYQWAAEEWEGGRVCVAGRRLPCTSVWESGHTAVVDGPLAVDSVAAMASFMPDCGLILQPSLWVYCTCFTYFTLFLYFLIRMHFYLFRVILPF